LGNFLVDEPFARFDYVFEHTLFCAIQPTERDAYLNALKRWLRPDGTYVAVFYMIPDEDGPPFGTTREEIKRRFGTDFELLENWVPRSYPNRTDLEWMTVWKRK
jgi:methyl halide transferase